MQCLRTPALVGWTLWAVVDFSSGLGTSRTKRSTSPRLVNYCAFCMTSATECGQTDLTWRSA